MSDVRGDLLATLVYDSALIAKLHEQLSHVIHLFSARRGQSVLTDRTMAVILYYALCRLLHRSGLTVGEELSVSSRAPRLSKRTRMAWFLASISFPLLKESVIPIVRSRSTRLSQVLDVVSTLSSDAFFLLYPRATATSFVEQRMTPRSCLPRHDAKPTITIAGPILTFSGIIVFLECVRKLKLLVDQHKGKPDFIDGHSTVRLKKLDWASCSSGECAVCMCELENPTATVCGHIFCYECISEWTKEEGSPCPVCRTDSLPQDLLPLNNYAPNDAKWKPFWNRPLILNHS
jgi:hypothetical protein